MRPALDLDLLRDALASGTLNHGLKLLGDRWTVAVLLCAFTGVQRFDDWQLQLGIPRPTLAARLKSLTALGLLRKRAYQARPVRYGYHLTRDGLSLYGAVLMIWTWERRWGTRELALPSKLLHQTCGHTFVPVLSCKACAVPTRMTDLRFSLHPNTQRLDSQSAAPRATRVAALDDKSMSLGLRVDRWTLLIIASVVLGCHHFDQLVHALGISNSVLARRLAAMVQSGLLLAQSDLSDARRTVYRLTPASRDLFGYIVCFADWASTHHFQEASSIAPVHQSCCNTFVPQVVCSRCQVSVKPHDVSFSA